MMLLLKQAVKKIRWCGGIVLSMTAHRVFINSSNDTGYKLPVIFKRKFKADLVQPVVIFHDAFAAPRHLRYKLGIIFERLVPDALSYVPKSRGYFVGKGFQGAGLVDLTHLGWEEFMWQGQPFGFHMRRFNKSKRNIHEELLMIDRVLGGQ